MDGSTSVEVFEIVTETVDLTPVLDSLSRIEELLYGLAAAHLVTAGVILAAAVVLVLAVMWR